MRNAVVVGNSLQVLGPVMLAIRSFSHAKINVIGNDSTRSIRWSLLCDEWRRHSLAADEDLALLSSLQSICARDLPARIIAIDCEAARALNRLRPFLPAPLAPMPSSDHLAMLEDKWQFHRLCQLKGLPTPLTIRFENKQSLRYGLLASILGSTFVIKPSNLAGSQGVRIIRNEAMFESEILKSDDYQYSPLLAQEYIPGEDIDISLLAIKGKVMTLATQQVTGSVVRFISQPQMEAMATVICTALCYDGVMHIDARIDPHSGRIWLIESNPRFWASLTAALWCGLNFVQESLRHVREPEHAAGPLRLAQGRAHTRFPLLRQDSLRCLLARDSRGRLLRWLVLDPWRIQQLVLDLSTLLMRRARAGLPRLQGVTAPWRQKSLQQMVSKCN
ncbi:MAG: ATP-grasp domain-containing protein [Oxalobacteraceae bacterium]